MLIILQRNKPNKPNSLKIYIVGDGNYLNISLSSMKWMNSLKSNDFILY